MATGQGNIKITADTSQAQSELKALERSLDRLDKVGQAAMSGIEKALATVTAAAAGVTYALAKAAISLDDLGDAADAIGIGVNQLRDMQAVAASVGVDAGALEKVFKTLSGTIGEGFADNTSKAAAGLRKIGLDANDLIGLSVDQQLIKITQALGAIENPTIRSALAFELLGKNANRVVEAFKDPSKLEEWSNRLKALGLAISETDKANVDKLVGQVEKLKKLWDAFLQKAVAALAPYLIEIIDRINESIDSSGGFEKILLDILDAFEAIAKAAMILATVYIGVKLVGAFRDVGDAISDVLLLLTPAGWIGRVAKIVRGVMAATGLIAAGAAATMAADMSSKMGDEFDKIRESLKKTREERQKVPDLSKEDEQEKARLAKLAAEAKLISDIVGKIENEKIPAIKEEIRLETIRNTQGDEEYEVQKIISEMFKGRLDLIGRMNQEVLKKLRDEQASLNLQKGITAEIKKQENLIKSLAEKGLQEPAYSKAVSNYWIARDALVKANNEMGGQLPSGAVVSSTDPIKQGKLNKDPRVVAENALRGANLAMEAEAAVAKSKYDKLFALDNQYAKDKKDLEDSLKTNQDAMAMARELGESNLNAKLIKQRSQLLDAQRQMEIEYQDQRILAEQAVADRSYQIELNRINKVLMANKSRIAQTLTAEQQAALQKQGESERQKQYVASRIEFEKKSEAEKYAFAIDQGAQMFSALGAQNKKAFEAAKAFNIANAIMNTYMAATKALASYPPPFNFIAMAAAIGMGMAQVAAIRSQQYSGRALGGPVMGGQSYIVGENGPELFTPNTTGSITRNSDIGGAQPVVVNFNINAVDADGIDNLLINRRSTIQQIISDAMLEKGQRM